MQFQDFQGQSQHIERLRREFAAHSFSHAYLFTGPAGTGKRSVARLAAAAALCRGEDKPCGVCGPCRRVAAGTHPDVHELLPETGKRDIGVAVVRAALSEVSVRAFEDGAKVFLVPQADRLSPQAQNALLKTLEEPPDGTVFILCTDKPSALLPTVASRLRIIRFHPLSQEAATQRLMQLGVPQARASALAALTGGLIGPALAMDEGAIDARKQLQSRIFSIRRVSDIPAVAAQYKDEKLDRQAFLDSLEGIVRDLLAARASGVPLSPELCDAAALAYGAAVPLQGMLSLMEKVQEARRMMGSYVSFAALLERILLEMTEEYKRWPW